MLRVYEALLIFRPDLNEEEISQLHETFEKFIEEGGGKIIGKDDWGVRKLAYPINKCEEGHYTIWNFEGGPELAEKLKTAFSKEERILRKLIFRKK
ncbi:MAG TPA: 30S ribosomal protein S6 [bacterium]|nr:30S ribosomal protein S6 [bacterium]HEX67615.1 30S ribosomal protein S6 [bacterium]